MHREFRRWIKEGGEADHATSRHHACVMVDQESLDSVLKEAPPPEEFDMFGRGWVYLISSLKEGSGFGDDEDDDYDDDEEDGEEGDEEEEEVEEEEGEEDEEVDGEGAGESEGDREKGEVESKGDQEKEENDEVYYTRVGLSYLVPRVYTLLEGPGWHNFAGVEGSVAVP